jgi:hypothetical protein
MEPSSYRQRRSAMTDTGSKSFDCALVSILETYDDPENGNYLYYTHYRNYVTYAYYTVYADDFF